MLLRYSLALEAEAAHLEAAVAKVLDSGPYPKDLRGDAGTAEIAAAIFRHI